MARIDPFNQFFHPQPGATTMRTPLLFGLAALLAAASLQAASVQAADRGFGALQRPTISNVGVRATSTGATDVNIRQNSQYNAAAVVLISPRGSVNIEQAGRGANAATVGAVGRRTDVSIGQFGGRFGNSAAVTVRSPQIR